MNLMWLENYIKTWNKGALNLPGRDVIKKLVILTVFRLSSRRWISIDVACILIKFWILLLLLMGNFVWSFVTQ